MTRKLFSIVVGAGLFVTACSPASSFKYGSVQGKVTHMGAPLADATVTFIPEKGPASFAVTDESGSYSISSRQRGVAAGNVKVAVAIAGQGESSPTVATELTSQPKTSAEAQAYLKKASEMQQQIAAKQKAKKSAKALIPKKYSNAETSNLNLTVKPGETVTFDIPITE